MHHCIVESGQYFECDFKRFKEGTEERNLFLKQNQNIFIFSAYNRSKNRLGIPTVAWPEFQVDFRWIPGGNLPELLSAFP